ncbi:PTS sugar transporter subunit IIC [Clostridium sp. MCC353]|uniref:PTS mannose/fructose/sorbose/N-acetylgalactosamine transporter subunit IIC n=1 Tax=Clostridium sp. MCC353 TaxID=2592646 RepID=UPI001C023AA9|nr:PTS sugar transporter subunit IIC [Clostridium sp. MCC353]MBT9776590.1 PTS sugar transporter subunit IIC [Clostridium sp. MCC353]
MIVQALFVALVMYFAKFTDWVGQLGVRPLVLSALVGLVLGHPVEGVILGASLELVFIGAIQIGGSVPQDFISGAILGSAFSILLGQDSSVAVTLAVPISLAATMLFQLETIVWTALVPVFDRFLEEKNYKKYAILHYTEALIHPIPYCLITFLAIAFGTEGIQSFINGLPVWVMNGFAVASGILPALGFAMLLKMLWDKTIICFFFFGFFTVKYFTLFMNISVGEGGAGFSASSMTMPMAILAGCIAVFFFFQDSERRKSMAAGQGSQKEQITDEREDFFQ